MLNRGDDAYISGDSCDAEFWTPMGLRKTRDEMIS